MERQLEKYDFSIIISYLLMTDLSEKQNVQKGSMIVLRE
jgi:hypothetical protein